MKFLPTSHLLLFTTPICHIASGFLPKDTAAHHCKHVLEVLAEALVEAKLSPQDLDAIAYTKGNVSILHSIHYLHLLGQFYDEVSAMD